MAGGGGVAAVVYHHPCPDGVFAALAAHLYHSSLALPVVFFPNTVYSPLKVEDFESNAFKVIYLLDFIGPKGFAIDLCTKAKRVVILDHHKTAYECLVTQGLGPCNMIVNIDMGRSGAILAYDYFSRKLQSYLPTDEREQGEKLSMLIAKQHEGRIRLLFEYIEDADLWTWSLPNSKAFSAGLKSLHLDYNTSSNPLLFEQLLSLDPTNIINIGKSCLGVKQLQIDVAVEKSFTINLGNGTFGQCLVVWDDNVSELRSDLGHQLASKSLSLGLRPIGAVAYKVKEHGHGMSKLGHMLKVSLRGIEGVDTTEISEVYGGGGHQAASSFMISKEEFMSWVK